jgi:cysteinyl-tRNA synthetase
MDFVLWKPSKPGEPAWPSPGGIAAPGRPGWHIECSAMAEKHLGQIFDIHGGGIDLVFPHHEYENAQSRCAHGTPTMANVWMHNGFLQVEGEKMSKSLGNFVTIKELLDDWRGYSWPGQVVRFAMLSTHYRQPIDFSQDALEQASIALEGFGTWASDATPAPPSREFMDALQDDLNTPRAIAELHRLSGFAQRGAHELADRMAVPGALLTEEDISPRVQLAAGLRYLGIDIDSFESDWVQNQAQQSVSDEFRAQVEQLKDARLAARKAKNWVESDRIRDELAAMGIQLKDSKNPETGEIETTWEVKR